MGATQDDIEGPEPAPNASIAVNHARRDASGAAKVCSSGLAERSLSGRWVRGNVARHGAFISCIIVSALCIAGCSNPQQATSQRSPNTTSDRPTPSTSPPMTSTSPPLGSTTPVSGPDQTSTSGSAAGIEDLQATQGTQGALTTAYTRARGLPPGVVIGIAPTKLLYAYDSMDHTYWADAVFLYSPSAPQQDQLRAQDGGDEGLFSQSAGGAWNVKIGSSPSYCAQERFFPPEVISNWHLPTSTTSTC